MEILIFIFIIGWLLIPLFILNLYIRLNRLERLISKKFYNLEEKNFDKLINEIKKYLEKGLKKEEVKNLLLNDGWQLSDIDKAFNSISPTITSEEQEILLKEKFIAWLKEDWIVKIGAFLLILGFAWLTTYAFLNNWIGPMGRIFLGIVAGSLFILLGWLRINKYVVQGGVFLVLGSTTILLTIFAARAIYNFFTPISALIIMFLSTAFVALASVKYNSRVLSSISLVLASIAPLLTKSPPSDHIGLFSYLFVVILGAIWIVILTGQRELVLISLIIIWLYSLPHIISPSLFPLADIQKLIFFAYLFSALFFLTNTAGILKLRSKNIIPDLITAAGNGMFLLVWILAGVKEEWQSLAISLWMIAFLVGAFLIFKVTQRREPLYIYAGVGIAMLAAATSIELKGATLTIAYTIESGIISLISYIILKEIKIALNLSLLLLGPVILSLRNMFSSSWSISVINKDFFVLLILGLTLIGLGIFFWRKSKEIEDKKIQKINIGLLVLGSIYFYILLWLSLHAGFSNDNIAVMISIVIYTIIGLISYFYGLLNKKRLIRLYGTALIAFVTTRLLLIDVWQMELSGRIITFFLVGSLLISTAFLSRKKENENQQKNQN